MASYDLYEKPLHARYAFIRYHNLVKTVPNLPAGIKITHVPCFISSALPKP